ncbi:MAG: hypothetical protein FWD23_07295 [Oscillospiraceae bacterium]|nr:hypothetical protein [Oscillospiraceae bacterium]
MKKLAIKYEMSDPSAKPDSNPAAADVQPFGNAALLKYDNIEPPGHYATLEHNYYLLDDSPETWPENPFPIAWIWFSRSMSGANGIFAVPPTLDITFSTVHKSPGLTLFFYPDTDDYASQIRVTWYGFSGAVIKTGIYANDSVAATIKESVADYTRVKIEMLSTNNPYRYIKMFAIEYGIIFRFTDNMINTANLLEEIDPISDVLSVNTFDFNILQKNPEFADTGTSENEFLMKKQKLTLTADDEMYGVYFLDIWEDITLNNISFNFNCIDAVGAMQSYNFSGGLYQNEPLGSIVAQLFDICFPTGDIKFFIDPLLSGATITGYMPMMDCRQALQWLCFAVGATADASRRNTVWVYPRDDETTYYIPRVKVYRNGKMRNRSYRSGVDVTAHEFIEGDEPVELYNGELPVGKHTILFNEPAHTLSVAGAAIDTTHINYAVVNVAAEGEVVLSGLKYIHNELIYSVKDEYIVAGEIEDIVVLSGCTLINSENALLVAQNIYDYYKYRTVVETDIVLDGKEVGYRANIFLQNKKAVNGIIESLDINLRANRAKSKIVGKIVETKFIINKMPPDEEALYIWKDEEENFFTNDKFWIDGSF